MKNNGSRIVVTGLSEDDAIKLAGAVKTMVRQGYQPKTLKVQLDHPEPPDPPVLFPKVYDKICDLIGTINDHVDDSPELGDEDSDGEGSTTISGVRQDARVLTKFRTKLEGVLYDLEMAIDDLSDAADILEADQRREKDAKPRAKKG